MISFNSNLLAPIQYRSRTWGMEGNLIPVRYNALLPQGPHHRTCNEVIPRRVGTGVISRRRSAKLNETPEINRSGRAPDEKKRIKHREAIPLHRELYDRRHGPRDLCGLIICPQFGLRPPRRGVKATPKVPEMLANVQIHGLQDGSDVCVKRPVVKNNLLIVPDRNSWQGHTISPLAYIATTSIYCPRSGAIWQGELPWTRSCGAAVRPCNRPGLSGQRTFWHLFRKAVWCRSVS